MVDSHLFLLVFLEGIAKFLRLRSCARYYVPAMLFSSKSENKNV